MAGARFDHRERQAPALPPRVNRNHTGFRHDAQTICFPVSAAGTGARRLPERGAAADHDRRARRPRALHGRLVRDRQHSDVHRARRPQRRRIRTGATPTAASRPRSLSDAGGFDGDAETLSARAATCGHRIDGRVGHAVRVADQGRVPHRLSRPGLLADRHRPRQARLRVGHGAHAGDPGGGLRRGCSTLLARPGYDVTKLQRVPQRW